MLPKFMQIQGLLKMMCLFAGCVLAITMAGAAFFFANIAFVLGLPLGIMVSGWKLGPTLFAAIVGSSAWGITIGSLHECSFFLSVAYGLMFLLLSYAPIVWKSIVNLRMPRSF